MKYSHKLYYSYHFIIF